ncbi:quinol monooxygenase YgiN [Idiomarina loihiensis]|uniref:putative quinol monooxygenase n=1 Tax=Idiomarina TaxID=135575 RepID=UPI000D713D5B|nr:MULTISPECIES: putative quinol monooxygenase [Idiomarina]PWW39468.1 quinol monooxygenase YgiN [Idiomarina loihiensis]TDP49437.1 quinol monooxygenase YgiN [Idiomarina loihiensis]TDS24249.1 quinol monooxygenase YgiN [Idiomarina sp. H2]
MLNIVAKISPKTDQFDNCLERIQAIVPDTREEPGCLRFEVYCDKDSQNIFLIERFTNTAALDSHYAKDYTKDVFSFYEEALASPVRVDKMYEV